LDSGQTATVSLNDLNCVVRFVGCIVTGVIASVVACIVASVVACIVTGVVACIVTGVVCFDDGIICVSAFVAGAA